jgi:hypothetical protein
MLKLLDSIDKSKYSRRCYVVAATDKMSGSKAVAKEQSWQTSPKVGAPPAPASRARASAACRRQTSGQAGPRSGQAQLARCSTSAPPPSASRRPSAWGRQHADAAAASRCSAPCPPPLPRPQDYEVQVIPRSREVGQSYITSVGTTIYSLLFAARLVWRQRPNLVGGLHQWPARPGVPSQRGRC